jgi:acyl transferase domain-containing protein
MAIGDLKGMRPAQEALAARVSLDVTLAGVRGAAPSIPLLSSVTGRMMESAEALNTDYWLGQIQEPVGFSGRAGTLARLGVDVVVEVGTDFMMARTFGDAWPDSAGAPVVLPTLVSGDGESPESDDGFVRAVAGAYETGLDVSFEGLFAGEARRRIALPTYPFQRRRHWI